MLKSITKASNAPEYEESRPEALIQRFAIALKMDDERGLCPQVTAKARGKMAEHLLEMARKYGIPVEENPNIMDGLKFLDVGQHVPESFFPLLAELLSHVEGIRRELELRKGKSSNA